ncbi:MULTISPECIES: aminoglycoside phosphotransferase family protein [Turicibacter]|jgi:phosphotransferase enzyme family protein|uniref:aminoglycoside phosphotransferase family protein n=2 Tax=Turicibacteraceae TaxID=2810281 RepID=UPI0001FDA094|nr:MULTISPECIES: phosphotransferase [Turicibacter]EGC90683.1 phosphotransferase enzyme family [Turicibacter sp. HGF1]MCU7201860.1 phosphotransferase [Turicibacter sanguinis]MDB8438480.1 phosphotransferase [Turicibacter sanguinis]MDB8459317.1 phosphotransferase [Turicibacter sanguinis]MDB8543473.1 phosphotransferase [Turicibacter sanguinis]
MESVLKSIAVCQSAKIVKKVEAGWSSDVKYYVLDAHNREYMLRLSDISQDQSKRIEFERIQNFNTLDFEMSRAVEFGTCNAGSMVYMLLTWVAGESLESSLKVLSEQKQYELGIKAGKILKAIHDLPTIEVVDVLAKKEKMLEKLARYERCGYRVEQDDKIINYIKSHLDDLNDLKAVMNHGDYHVGNLILTSDFEVGVIDFNRMQVSDHVEDFYKVQSFNVEVSIPFSIGQIHGYFQGNPSEEFWKVLALYNAYAALNSITWATKFGQEEIEGMIRRCRQTMKDYDSFTQVVPRWYVTLE